MYIVVGSGPAGVSCAKALLDQGAEVTLLDVGVECEPSKTNLVNQLASQSPEHWKASDIKKIAAPFQKNAAGFPLKRVYGSAYPYGGESIEQHGVQCLQSIAKGGLSAVWGAAVLPYQDSELQGWPAAARNLGAHYEAVSKFLPIAGVNDDLQNSFPFYQKPSSDLGSSRQAEWILQRLGQSRDFLRGCGIVFGKSRLAVQQGCRHCGLCLSGCPYRVIYNAAETVDELRKNSRFKYLSGMTVLECERESEKKIRVWADDLASKKRVAFSATRVFLAAGVLPTLRIAARTLRMSQANLTLPFHPYFMQPMLMLKKIKQVERERLHTLAQVFIEISDQSISRQNVHLQLYTFNSLFSRELPLIARVLGDRLLGRLVVIQGYLHSTEASPIRVSVQRESTSGKVNIELRGELDAHARACMRKVFWKLARLSLRTGLWPLPFTMRRGHPGDGNHIGGTFPMRDHPSAFESDLLGQPSGSDGKVFERVHLVDASVLPSLAATTITFTVMANAHRIATQALRLDRGNNNI